MNQYMHFNFQFDITTRCAQAHKICKNLHIYIDSLLASLRSQRFHRKKREKNPKNIQKIFPEKNSKKVLQKKILKYFRPKLLFIQFEVGLQNFWGSWPAGLVGDRERTDSTKRLSLKKFP
jgi:hypothetical protein